MRALQQAALPEIKAMLQSNPLSTYAAWSPRQIAGSNPAYDQLFAQAGRMGPALGGLNLIFGEPQTQIGDGGGSMAIPSMGGGTGSMGGQGSTVAAPPPQFQPPNIQDIINQQVAAQVTPAVQTAVNTASPPRNSVQGSTYYDLYGNPHDLTQMVSPGTTGFALQDPSTGYYGDPYISSSGGGIPLSTFNV